MKRWSFLLAAALMCAAFWAAQTRAQDPLGDTSDLRVVAPADNPSTPAKVELGRLLFWDPILSGDKDVACATCHHPAFGYSDGLPLSVGVNGTGVGPQRTFVGGAPAVFAKRNSQTILNTAFNGVLAPGTYAPALAPMFWDTRASGLEEQALGPIKSAEEMRGNAYSEEGAVAAVVARLRSVPEYVALFKGAFSADAGAVTATNLARAIATFERSLVAVNAPYDRYRRGDTSAMTALQIEGMREFERVGCVRCHTGPFFSDFKPHVLGVADNASAAVVDVGAGGTRAFRTPSLRNLAYTAPYMHSGVLTSVNEVLRFYNRVGRGGGGGRGARGGGGRRGDGTVAGISRPQLDPLLRELRGVGRSREEIVAFLSALNDDAFDRSIPLRVPSGLHPGGRLE